MESDSATIGQPARARVFAGLTAVPLFHAAWLFAAGIAATHMFWLRPGLLIVELTMIAALAAVSAQRAQRIAWLPMALLWALLGVWCAEMQPQPASAPDLLALSNGLMRTVEGTVVDAGPIRGELEQNLDEPADALPVQPSQRIDVRLNSIEVVTDDTDAQTPTSGSVRLTVRWPTPPSQTFHCGERIRATVRLLLPETYHDPGVWSRTGYLLDQDITSTASVKAASIESLEDATGASFHCRVIASQRAASARLLALPAAMHRLPALLRLSEDDAIMLAAMVTGDRTFLTHSLRVGFERTGSFHMLVVSGFHLAIMAGCIFWVTRRLRIPRVPATLLTIAASFAYALFTGFATPVQRSLWMVTLYLVGRLVYRERSPLNTIGFAALCLLVASPRSLFESSFQMTLLAVVCIGGIAVPLLAATVHPHLVATADLRLLAIDPKLAPPIAQFRVTLRMFAQRIHIITNRRIAWRIFPATVRFTLRLVELLVVTCVVELAMTLPMAIYFHRITLFALPVNLLILPLLLVMMPAALFTLVLLFVWPAAATVPGAIVALLLHFGVDTVHLFGSLAFGDLRISTPMAIQSAAFCLLLAAALVLARLNSAARWPRRTAWAAMILAALIAIAPRPIDRPHGALLVEAIDVGQGDSLLLITPDGKTLLVDGGGFGGGPRQAPQEFDIGEEVVSPALWARGIRHLDIVALTHAHADHMGGLPAVLRNFHPDELWVGNNPRFGAYNDLLSEAEHLHVRIRSLHAGDAFPLGSTQVNVLAPFAGYQPGPVPTNNDSMVLHIAYRATSVLLEGDAESPIEDAMLAESGLASTLLKVGHHGSLTSTRPEFLARVSPQWAVISCGLHNRYSHPRPEVLKELENAHIGTVSTDIHGISCFRLDGKTTQPDPSCSAAMP
jgi:competence protein ComEC